MRDMLGRWLEGEGAQVFLADNGKMAFRLATLHDPDIILIDLKMPDVNGITAIRSLRMLLKDKPIVVFTGYASEENKQLALQAGADDILYKPMDMNDLLGRILSFLPAGEVA